jgi:putative flavoprotein involved in K+ transport
VPFSFPQYISVVIIGGGQAGLSASYCLRQRGVDDHVILEKNRVGDSWRTQRWDIQGNDAANSSLQLPDSWDPDESHHDTHSMVERLERYVLKLRPPILEQTTVTSVTKREGYFHLTTNRGNWFCDDVIVAIGGQHTPFIPRGAEHISTTVTQLHSRDYQSHHSLPEGEVLVVGAGPSGLRIAENLLLAGRKVHLCHGHPQRFPSAYRGREITDWLEDMGEFRRPKTRPHAEPYSVARTPSPDEDLQKFADRGVKLYGYLESINPGKITTYAGHENPSEDAERSYHECCQRIDAYILANHLTTSAPAPRPTPELTPNELPFAENNIRSIVWCTGYQPDFKFIQLPVFTLRGFPETERGLTALPGLYFLGLPWMHTSESVCFNGIIREADFIAAKIQASLPECVE